MNCQACHFSTSHISAKMSLNSHFFLPQPSALSRPTRQICYLSGPFNHTPQHHLTIQLNPFVAVDCYCFPEAFSADFLAFQLVLCHFPHHSNDMLFLKKKVNYQTPGGLVASMCMMCQMHTCMYWLCAVGGIYWPLETGCLSAWDLNVVVSRWVIAEGKNLCLRHNIVWFRPLPKQQKICAPIGAWVTLKQFYFIQWPLCWFCIVSHFFF